MDAVGTGDVITRVDGVVHGFVVVIHVRSEIAVRPANSIHVAAFEVETSVLREIVMLAGDSSDYAVVRAHVRDGFVVIVDKAGLATRVVSRFHRATCEFPNPVLIFVLVQTLPEGINYMI